VPQDNGLFSGSIREVVSYADPQGSTDENRLRAALEAACADEFVGSLDAGTDSLLGEHGSGLSEGQMQRLAIARAVFSGRPVLLLDEATGALDEDTEKRVLENLHALADRTVIIVTHRPAALAYCDRVYRFSEKGVRQV
jgi:ATP-binding cassette subfamily B protein